MEKEFIFSNMNDWLGIVGSIARILPILVTCITGSIKFIEKCRNGVAYRKGKIGPIKNETLRSWCNDVLRPVYEEFTILIVMILILAEMKTATVIGSYREIEGTNAIGTIVVLIAILLIVFNGSVKGAFKPLYRMAAQIRCIIWIGCDMYLLNMLFLLVAVKEEIILAIMKITSLGFTVCIIMIGYQLGLNYKCNAIKVCKKIRCVMLVLYVITIFDWEKANLYVMKITWVWIGWVLLEYICYTIFEQENKDIKVITTYGEYITQRAIKRYQGNKVQYRTTKKETFILELEDVERIEYNRPYWKDKERKKLKKKEVKCELYNGNILAGNQVMILNEDWIRLEIQENTDILVKILKCKDVRKVEMIHK